jgi:hypothetical protein
MSTTNTVLTQDDRWTPSEPRYLGTYLHNLLKAGGTVPNLPRLALYLPTLAGATEFGGLLLSLLMTGGSDFHNQGTCT